MKKPTIALILFLLLIPLYDAKAIPNPDLYPSNNECAEGEESLSNVDLSDDVCEPVPGYGNICSDSKCGDGKCEDKENECNCEKDCKRSHKKTIAGVSGAIIVIFMGLFIYLRKKRTINK